MVRIHLVPPSLPIMPYEGSSVKCWHCNWSMVYWSTGETIWNVLLVKDRLRKQRKALYVDNVYSEALFYDGDLDTRYPPWYYWYIKRKRESKMKTFNDLSMNDKHKVINGYHRLVLKREVPGLPMDKFIMFLRATTALQFFIAGERRCRWTPQSKNR